MSFLATSILGNGTFCGQTGTVGERSEPEVGFWGSICASGCEVQVTEAMMVPPGVVQHCGAHYSYLSFNY